MSLGPRDLDAGTAVIAQPLGSEGKRAIQLTDASSMLSTMLDDYQNFLLERATAFRDSNTVVATTCLWVPLVKAWNPGPS